MVIHYAIQYFINVRSSIKSDPCMLNIEVGKRPLVPVPLKPQV